MNRRRLRYAVAVVLVLSLAGASFALASGGDKAKGAQFRAHMIPYGEVPSLNSTGHADLTLNVTDTTITFKLDYADLTGPPLFSHIHVGQVGVNGGVSVFFCGGGGKPACPASNSGSVSGSIVAADVVGPTAQGFDAGNITPLVAAIRAGVTYANMHTMKFPAGEIRGQLVPDKHGDGNSEGDG
jgi:CHRD domain